MSVQNARWDVCIVGAGLAGLSCALTLSRKTPGKSILILEASPQVGGRIETRRSSGGWYEMGAQWVGPRHTHMLALLKNFGVLTVAQKWVHEVEVLESAEVEMLEEYGSDSMTVADMIRRYRWAMDDEAVLDLELLIRSCFACEPSEVSPHFVAWAVRACGGVDALADGPAGAQSMHVAGGLSDLLAKIDARLKKRGCVIKTGSPVSSIERRGDGVRVTTTTGTEDAAAVVVAMSPPGWRRIVPNLPREARLLSDGMFMGSALKTVAVYKEPFWEVRPPSGRLELIGPVCCAFPMNLGDKHALVGLVTGEKARKLKGVDKETVRDLVQTQYVTFYGNHTPPLEFFDCKDWSNNPHIGGCFSALPKPGVLSALTTAHQSGPVFFACTELSAEWPGYMEGAVRSGRKTARSIITSS